MCAPVVIMTGSRTDRWNLPSFSLCGYLQSVGFRRLGGSDAGPLSAAKRASVTCKRHA